jgi:hypothetical protein
MGKHSKRDDDVKVEHKQHGCPIDQRRDAHTHTQKDWREVVDKADPFRKR